VSSIAATRLATHLKGFGIEEQAGSTPEKGCADATFTLKTALQTLREHGQESWVLFVDLVKAYDTVNREMLWKILRTLGVPESLIAVSLDKRSQARRQSSTHPLYLCHPRSIQLSRQEMGVRNS
jgi:hypothetical protein